MKFVQYLINRPAVVISLLATTYMAVMLPLYAWQEPARLEDRELQILLSNLDAGMTIYSENCAMCHGMAGEGIGANPPLSDPALAQMDYTSLHRAIESGLYGTTMPPWGQEVGGPLTDYQISQLVALIQNGNWQTTQERVVNLGLQPLIPFNAEPDTELIELVAALPGGELKAQGIALYAEQCVSCHGPDGLGTGLAPALNTPEVRQKPAQDLERAVNLGIPGTLMAGWQNILTTEDVAALMALIVDWDVVPAGSIPAPDIQIQVTEESLALGDDLYSAYCSRCHGSDGQGTPRAPALNVKGFLENANDMAIQQIIALGVPGTSMLAWETRLNEIDIQAIVGFIRAWEPTAPEVAEPARGGMGAGRPNSSSQANDSQKGPPWLRGGYPEDTTQ